MRTITEESSGKYKVVLTITKENIEGFSKIIEQIPSGFSANEGVSKEGIFSFKNQEAKILWMSIPKDEEINVSYYLVADANTTNKEYSINGTFTYLHNDETNKYIINPSTVELNVTETIAEEPEEKEDTVVSEDTEEITR